MNAASDPIYSACRKILRWLLRLFFREVMIEGVDNVPTDRGGLLVASHPNGLIDPALMLTAMPGRVVFGARHGLFEWPLLGRLMRRLGAVPIYRRQDESGMSTTERWAANARALDGLARAIAEGSYSALFPEGMSHDLPHLSELKTGAARLYYQARSVAAEGSPTPVILPVGLYYDRKNLFRSRVLVSVFPPLQIPGQLDRDTADSDTIRALTARIGNCLDRIVGSTEDWKLHHLMHRAGKLIRAELAWRAGADPGKRDLSERRLTYERMWEGYRQVAASDSDRVKRLRADLSGYDRTLRLLALADHELTSSPRLASPKLVALLVAQFLIVYLILPPILLLGLIVNVVPYQFLKAWSRRVSAAKKDEATVKLFGGLILFPLFWTLIAVGAWFAHNQVMAAFPGLPDVAVLVGALTFLVCGFGGVLALVYAELSARTMRAVRVRVIKRRRAARVAHLIEQRSALCDELLALGEGLALPGRRLSDGRLVPD